VLECDVTPSTVDEFNRAPASVFAERLHACNASQAWVDAMLAARPYRDVDSLLSMAEKTARSLDWADVQEALNTHPRIGENASGNSVESAWSREEQGAVSDSDAATHDALRAGNIAYEQRFGHVFLIRAAGRSAEEMLAELRRRLESDETTERAEVTEQLAQITRLRLERLLAE
jgi:2-oxo-4-hydroxy-4-carboxy-5-ureidoimidazoline decarboxylase